MTKGNPPKIDQGLTQWALVTLGPTLIYNTNKKEQSYVIFIYQYLVTHKNWPGVNPMGLDSP